MGCNCKISHLVLIKCSCSGSFFTLHPNHFFYKYLTLKYTINLKSKRTFSFKRGQQEIKHSFKVAWIVTAKEKWSCNFSRGEAALKKTQITSYCVSKYKNMKFFIDIESKSFFHFHGRWRNPFSFKHDF